MIDVRERLKSCYESCDVYELLLEVAAERDALTAKVAELEKQNAVLARGWESSACATVDAIDATPPADGGVE